RSIPVIIRRQPGANIIEVIDRVKALIPELTRSINPAIDVTIALDRSTTIRASVIDVERTLLISIGLVVLVVFLFLRNVRATAIPSVAVPLSLIGTFGAMYLCGYSLDNLSLMALTISTGFVVDDAIVVTENVSRFIEAGDSPMQAAFNWMRDTYGSALRWVLEHEWLMLAATGATIAFTVYLYVVIPKGLFPQQDTGSLAGGSQAPQDISFPAMKARTEALNEVLAQDPNIE